PGCIQKQIIYIKAPYFRKELKYFHKKADSKTIKHGKEKTPVPVSACHRHKETKRHKNQYISNQIGKCQQAELFPVRPESPDFSEQFQIVMILPHLTA